MNKDTINELKSMGFHLYGTHNYPVFSVKDNMWVVDSPSNRKGLPVRKKISVRNFQVKYDFRPLPSSKVKQLFYNVWFNTEEEAWGAAKWFVDNYLETPEIKELLQKEQKLIKEQEKLQKQIRKLRRENKDILKHIVNQWQMKEEWK
jgi:hypothetical protein